MNKFQYEKFIFDDIIKTVVQEKQFNQWLRRFFYLNHELNKEYDPIYQDAFYVVFYELVTVGLKYASEVLNYLKNGGNKEKTDFYIELTKELSNLKSEFSKTEFQFIEYKRHGSSHIFQNHYINQILDSGKIQTKRKGKLIDDIDSELKSVIIKHGSDKKFDHYVAKKIYPKIIELYNRLEKIKAHNNNV